MIWTIAKRELSTRGRSKGYIGITAILFLFVIAGVIASSVLGGGDDKARKVDIGITETGAEYNALLADGSASLDPTITMFDTQAAGVAELTEGTIDVLFDGMSLTWDGLPDGELTDFITASVQQQTFGARATELGLTGDDLGVLFAQVELDEVRLDGGDEDRTIRLIVGGVAGLVTFFLLQTWGSFVMMGVIEEKSSKVVEILLSQVRPATLLSGKVIGLGILAIVQMLIVAAGLIIALALTRDIEVPNGLWTSVPLLVVTFVVGFGFYSCLFAAVGSTVSRQEDAMSAQAPAMLPLFIGYFIAASSLSNPENPALTVASFVPFSSPVVLPLRTALVDVPMWQVIVSLLILAASAVLMLQVAGQIYRYTLLSTGSRIKLTDAWKNRKTGEL